MGGGPRRSLVTGGAAATAAGHPGDGRRAGRGAVGGRPTIDGVARAAISLVGPTDKVLADIQNPARLVLFASKKLSRELCL